MRLKTKKPPQPAPGAEINAVILSRLIPPENLRAYYVAAFNEGVMAERRLRKLEKGNAR